MAWPAGLPAGRSRARYRQKLAPLSTWAGKGEFITPPCRPKSQIPAGRFWALREKPVLGGDSSGYNHLLAVLKYSAGTSHIKVKLVRAARSVG